MRHYWDIYSNILVRKATFIYFCLNDHCNLQFTWLKVLRCITNTSRVFHVETTWKPSFSCQFNAEYTWCVSTSYLLGPCQTSIMEIFVKLILIVFSHSIIIVLVTASCHLKCLNSYKVRLHLLLVFTGDISVIWNISI